MGIGGFGAMRALSTRNDDPERSSRPFDRDRDGFVLGEGAGVLVLEELEFAQARGARIYAELVGYGMSADAYHMTAPSEDGDGAVRVMKAALESARQSSPAAVDYINAHGTSTPHNDRIETLAIKRCFGDHARRLAVSSTKSMTGHLLGAAGGLEAGITALALAPADRAADDQPRNSRSRLRSRLRAAHAPRELPMTYALSNSFGFGGTNAALLFKRYEGSGQPGLGESAITARARQDSTAGSSLTDSMKIAVCIKQVPTREWQPRLERRRRPGSASRTPAYEMNEPDAYALEEALRLKEKHGGEVVVCSAGPARVAQVIREALARGADRAIHVEDDAARRRPTRSAVAGALAAAMREEAFDLVLTGLQSDDQGHAQTGVDPGRAARPAARHDHHGRAGARTGALRVKRELEGGWFQWVAHAAAGGADDSERHQPAALRDAQGHHGGEEEGDSEGRAAVPPLERAPGDRGAVRAREGQADAR